MAINIIVGTCVAVFVVTAAITLLGITNRLEIDKRYLNALFAALILEIVAIGVIGFRATLEDDIRGAFVRITYPLAALSVETQTEMFIAGVAAMNRDQALSCRVATASDTVVYHQVTLKSKGFFDLSYELAGRAFPLDLSISCSVREDDRTITADTSRVRLTR